MFPSNGCTQRHSNMIVDLRHWEQCAGVDSVGTQRAKTVSKSREYLLSSIGARLVHRLPPNLREFRATSNVAEFQARTPESRDP